MKLTFANKRFFMKSDSPYCFLAFLSPEFTSGILRTSGLGAHSILLYFDVRMQKNDEV